MGELFNYFDVEPVCGKDITIGDNFPELYISDLDEVFCYAGICLNDIDDRRKASFMHPYYMVGRHSTDKNIAKKIKRFYRIAEGCIVLDNYLDNHFRNERIYKKVDVGIRFPMPDTYYGVLTNYQEDKALTRAVFGLTCKELTDLLEVYGKVMGTYSEYISYPKLTRSIRSVNYCAMTDIWIPEKFPYIAFSESGYRFSHVSLWGFYQHVQLLTGCRMSSVISQCLLKAGVDEETLKRLFELGKTIYHQTKVTKVTWE